MEDSPRPKRKDLKKIISSLKFSDSSASETVADSEELKETDNQAEESLHQLYEAQEEQNSSE